MNLSQRRKKCDGSFQKFTIFGLRVSGLEIHKTMNLEFGPLTFSCLHGANKRVALLLSIRDR
jgi:hypothetical protein